MPDVQHFLALLYTDDAFRERFIADPERVSLDAGFSREEAAKLAALDREALLLTARGFAKKRGAKAAFSRDRGRCAKG